MFPNKMASPVSAYLQNKTHRNTHSLLAFTHTYLHRQPIPAMAA